MEITSTTQLVGLVTQARAYTAEEQDALHAFVAAWKSRRAAIRELLATEESRFWGLTTYHSTSSQDPWTPREKHGVSVDGASWGEIQVLNTSPGWKVNWTVEGNIYDTFPTAEDAAREVVVNVLSARLPR